MSMRFNPAATAAILFVMTTGSAFAQDSAVKKFLTEAIQGNYAEVQMGELAQKNAQSEDTKVYGQMLATDHNDANKKATDAAKSLNINAPAGPSAKQKAAYDKMAKMNAAAFDKMFAQHMVADHKKDIAKYKAASKKQDAAGQYAQGALPTLQKHLEEAEKLAKQKTSGR
jgi:putative membrane protein